MDLADRIVGKCFSESNPYNSILTDNLVAIGNMINVGRDRTAINHSNIAQYSAILDDVTCPLCEYLDGMYFEVGSKEYYKYMPRVHISCRCIYVYIGKDEVNQPKPNFKEPSDTLKKLGHLTTGKQSVAGAIANATIPIVTPTLAKLPVKYSSIDYETNSENVNNTLLDVISNYDYPVEVINNFVKLVHEVLIISGEKDAINTALTAIDSVYEEYIVELAKTKGIQIIGKLSPLKLISIFNKVDKLSKILQTVGVPLDTIKISKNDSYKDGVVSTNGRIPYNEIINELDKKFGINDRWSIENNEPYFNDAILNIFRGNINKSTKRIAAKLNINPRDWYIQEVV